VQPEDHTTLEIMERLDYNNMPSLIRSFYTKEQFLSAHTSDLSNNLIVWVINPIQKKQLEIEFSPEEGRILSIHERLKSLPASQRVEFEHEGRSLILTTSYTLEEDCETLYQHHEIIDREDPSLHASTDLRAYHTPYRESPERIKTKLIKEIDQQLLYRSMSNQEKAAYWSSRLYRQRRQVGECGGDENAIFEKSFLDKLLVQEPNILSIMPECLRHLANMEQLDYDELIAEFKTRTGVELSC